MRSAARVLEASQNTLDRLLRLVSKAFSAHLDKNLRELNCRFGADELWTYGGPKATKAERANYKYVGFYRSLLSTERLGAEVNGHRGARR